MTDPRMWALVLDGVTDAECEAMERRLRARLTARGSADELCVRPTGRVEVPGLYESATVSGADIGPDGVRVVGKVAGWILRAEPGAPMFDRWLGFTQEGLLT